MEGGAARDVTRGGEALAFVVDGDALSESVTIEVDAETIGDRGRYWANLSDQPPRVLEADGGVLRWTLPWAANTGVRVEPAAEAAMAEGFDGGESWLPEGWKSDFETRGARAVRGGETAYAARPGLPLGDGEAMSVNLAEGVGRGGSGAVRVHKPTAGGEAYAWGGAAEVTPGTEYLAEAYYHVEQMAWGGMGSFSVELVNADGDSRYLSYERMNPLQDNRPDRWRRAFLRFTPRAGETMARLWLGVTAAPITLLFDDARIIEAPTAIERAGNPLPDDAGPARLSAEEVHAMLADETPRPAEVRTVRGQPTLHVDGEPVGNFSFNPGYYDWEAGQPAYHGVAGEQGVPIHTIPIALGDSLGGGDAVEDAVWQGPGDFDFSIIEERIVETLRRAPDALIRLNLSPEPYYGFHLDHPDALFRTAGGQVVTGYTHSAPLRDLAEVGDTEFVSPSYASATFRELSGDAFERVGRWLADHDLGKRVIGIHLIGGHDGQWLPHANKHGEHGMRDFGVEHVEAFRAYLREIHGDDAGLREAWGDPEVTLANALPADDAGFTADHVFFDPEVGEDRRRMDTVRFIQVGKVETIAHLLEAFDRGLGRPAFHSVYWSDVYHGHDLDHWALTELLRVDALDAVASIADYSNWRRQGRPGAISSAAASIRLHGKAFIAEVDHRTPHAWGNADANENQDWLGQIVDPLDPIHAARREWGQAMALGGGGWHYGLGGQGFAFEPYCDALGEAADAAQRLAEDPRLEADRPPVATFADERAVMAMSQRNIVNLMTAQLSANMARDPLSTSGLGYDPYLLTDLDHPDRPRYPVTLLLSAVTMTPEQVSWVEDNLQRDGRVIVVFHAAGQTHAGGVADTVDRLTGIAVEMDEKQTVSQRLRATGDDPLSEQIDFHRHETPGPLIRVVDEEAVPLATHAGREDVAAAIKRHDGWTGVYVAAPGALTPRLLRNLAAEAGVEPTGPEGDMTMAGNGLIVVHGMDAEAATPLRWDGPADLVDLTTGETVATGTASAEVDVPFGETRWFRRELR
ncbi:hypothetical protein PSMK_08870 [Phycisphaera mikurensis NBRC 102666]|uniref:Glycoside hydrolase family 42 N-terminal domain-containing protein n=1 Tax=Phycisphaera mikurensis (strain NBRC 102666 / KCTC 22515 / FYK2301M01) TaxID=1142394 RepID=I0ICQ8_PHYMF|nr:hypothetical protein PSMK_08870 [Phycisphaera mikurensis NBRC 102666]